MIRRVVLSRRAKKHLRKVPRHVVLKLQAWVELVEAEGLEEARKIRGFHDEPLHGRRRGQRSIRLSRSYRAIYEIEADRTGKIVSIEEISKHAY